MSNSSKFGQIDIPVSCSLFLEPALARYHANISPIGDVCGEYVHEWNRALLSVLGGGKYRDRLGTIGQKLIKNQGKPSAKNYLAMCVDHANDVKMQSLHYAIRFSESIRFIREKINIRPETKFVDMGCGLSPFAGATATEYKTTTAYCIDFPYISDVYDAVARTVGGAVPTFISWDDACTMATQNRLDTLVSMGVFHYMPINEQVARMTFTNKHFENFMIEIKYAATDKNANPNAFTLADLQKLRMDVPDVKTIETAMLAASMRYLHRFRTALPTHRDFVQDTRSLFLSR